MRIIELPEILAAVDEKAILDSIEAGFRGLAAGEADLMAVGYLGFKEPPGDCHVKGGYLRGDDVFVVKVATSFYRNAELGLSGSNGFMAVVSARTGETLAILHDRGRLTDLRTAMAGAIAARAIARPESTVLGVVGAGVQAKLQGELIARALNLKSVLVWARKVERASALASELGGEAVSLQDLCARADVIVTTTPSTEPILTADRVRPGTRIVAVGADAPGKRELDVELVARARLVVDSPSQCIDHGEAGWAVRAGLINADSLLELGKLLASPVAFAEDEIVVADLTGVGIQDVQIAKAIWARISAPQGFTRPISS
jgi:ornithine cyclodeaminase